VAFPSTDPHKTEKMLEEEQEFHYNDISNFFSSLDSINMLLLYMESSLDKSLD
jgi:hypothetical protein